MIQDITLPNFGSSVGESTLLKWLVAPGSQISAGQVIAEIETDKAIAELEAPAGGVIESIEIAEGTAGVAVGAVLARFRASGSILQDAGTDASMPETNFPHPVATPADAAALLDPSPLPAVTEEIPGEQSGRVFASPLARRLARERGMGLHGIRGSGPGGRIVSRDLEDTGAVTGAESRHPLEGFGYAADSYSLKPLTRIRRAIAEGLSRSVREIPSYSLTLDIALDAALHLRRDVNNGLEKDGMKVSITDLIIRACAETLVEIPEANSSWTDAGIALHRHANIALAVALDDGLVAPVLHGTDTMTLRQIAEASARVIHRSRQNKLTPADLQGATMTVSNLGMFPIRSFTSILSLPQACILSIGAAEPRPVVRDGELAIARIATFSLTCDHRVVDGAIGARFLSTLQKKLEAPGWLAEIQPA